MVFGVLLLFSIGLYLQRINQEKPFPGKTWVRVSPRKAGFSEEKLRAFSDRLGGAGCLAVAGRMAYTWGAYDRLYDIASAVKPFYTHFTLRAVQEGLIGSLDDRVVNWVPELRDLNEDLGYKDRAITFRHLLDQTSGYGLREPPGAAYGYNDYQTGLLIWTLLRRVYACGYGKADRTLFGERLGGLQFEDGPTLTHPHSWPGRLQISARDFARFGHVYLHKGQWRGGECILREDLIHEALHSPLPVNFPVATGEKADRAKGIYSVGGGFHPIRHAGSASFFWWLNRETPDGRLLLPEAPPQTFLATGYGGRFTMAVIPEYRMVVVWLDAFRDENLSPFHRIGRWKVSEAIRELLRARMGGGDQGDARDSSSGSGSRYTSGQPSLPE